jgi:hypothetical protein
MAVYLFIPGGQHDIVTISRGLITPQSSQKTKHPIHHPHHNPISSSILIFSPQAKPHLTKKLCTELIPHHLPCPSPSWTPMQIHSQQHGPNPHIRTSPPMPVTVPLPNSGFALRALGWGITSHSTSTSTFSCRSGCCNSGYFFFTRETRLYYATPLDEFQIPFLVAFQPLSWRVSHHVVVSGRVSVFAFRFGTVALRPTVLFVP